MKLPRSKGFKTQEKSVCMCNSAKPRRQKDQTAPTALRCSRRGKSRRGDAIGFGGHWCCWGGEPPMSITAKPFPAPSPWDSSQAGGEMSKVLVLDPLINREQAPTGAAHRLVKTRGGRRDPGDFLLFSLIPIESRNTFQKLLPTPE